MYIYLYTLTHTQTVVEGEKYNPCPYPFCSLRTKISLVSWKPLCIPPWPYPSPSKGTSVLNFAFVISRLSVYICFPKQSIIKFCLLWGLYINGILVPFAFFNQHFKIRFVSTDAWSDMHAMHLSSLLCGLVLHELTTIYLSGLLLMEVWVVSSRVLFKHCCSEHSCICILLQAASPG